MKHLNIVLPLVLLFTITSCKSDFQPEGGQPSEKYKSFSEDGAWSWFSEPRAISVKDKTYVGYVNREGSVMIGEYDHNTQQLREEVIHGRLQINDHNNPAILVRKDGHIMVIYSKHYKNEMYAATSTRPYDISEWNDLDTLNLNNPDAYPDGEEMSNRCTYANAFQLSDENGRIYVFWRGLDFKPNVAHSDDNGKTFTKGQIFIKSKDGYKHQRPYVKYASNNKDKIYMAFNDGHPKEEPYNNVYFAYYKDGAAYKVDGTKITSTDNLPIDPKKADLVYNAKETRERSWVWDVAVDKNGNPAIVYTRFKAEDDHRYYYAYYNGSAWQNNEITAAGKWFPNAVEGEKQKEPFYSGGLVINPENVAEVIMSRPVNGVYEIEKWTTLDQGKTWEAQGITRDSYDNNVRPYVVRNAESGGNPHILWIENLEYKHYTNFDSRLKMDVLK